MTKKRRITLIAGLGLLIVLAYEVRKYWKVGDEIVQGLGRR